MIEQTAIPTWIPITIAVMILCFLALGIMNWISGYRLNRAVKKVNRQMTSVANTMERSAQGMRRLVDIMSDCREEIQQLKDPVLVREYTNKLNQQLTKILNMDPNGYRDLLNLKDEVHTLLIEEDPNDPYVNSIEDLNA